MEGIRQRIRCTAGNQSDDERAAIERNGILSGDLEQASVARSSSTHRPQLSIFGLRLAGHRQDYDGGGSRAAPVTCGVR